MSCPSVSCHTVGALSLKSRRSKHRFLYSNCCFSGLTVSDVTVNSSGLLHTIKLQHFHQVALVASPACFTQCLCSCSASIIWAALCLQVYQAFRITVASQCKVHKGKFVFWCTVRLMCTCLKSNDNLVLSADRLPNVYRINVPWFREDSLTTVRWVLLCCFLFWHIYVSYSVFLSFCPQRAVSDWDLRDAPHKSSRQQLRCPPPAPHCPQLPV